MVFKKFAGRVVIIFSLYVVSHILEAVIKCMEVSRTTDFPGTLIYGISFFLYGTYTYFPPIAMSITNNSNEVRLD